MYCFGLTSKDSLKCCFSKKSREGLFNGLRNCFNSRLAFCDRLTEFTVQCLKFRNQISTFVRKGTYLLFSDLPY